jgi:predicted enzyme related to lactoylglutathione lyase
MKIELGHLCIEIGDFAKAMEFYRPLFRVTGFKRRWGGQGWAGYVNGGLSVFITETKPKRVVRRPPTGRESVVADHIAFALSSRRQVDLVAKTLEKAGFKALFPAQAYPEFGPDFYAASFTDPDNCVLEFCAKK